MRLGLEVTLTLYHNFTFTQYGKGSPQHVVKHDEFPADTNFFILYSLLNPLFYISLMYSSIKNAIIFLKSFNLKARSPTGVKHLLCSMTSYFRQTPKKYLKPEVLNVFYTCTTKLNV